MKVPMLDRQVQESPQLINAPQISGPVAGAFGENIAVATQNLGKGISSFAKPIEEIGTIIAKHKEELNKERATDAFNKASRDYQDLLFDPDLEDVKNPIDPNADPRSFGAPVIGEDGQPVQQIKGVLNRTGNAAYDAPVSFDQGSNTIIEKYSKDLDPGARDYFLKLVTPHSTSLRNNVFKYAAEQRGVAAKQNFLEFKDTALQNIPLQDLATRMTTIKDVNDRINDLEKIGRFSYEEAQKQREDFSSSLVDQDLAKDNATTPENSYTLNELIKGKDGAYPNLSDKDRAASVERMQVKINRNRKLNEFSVGQNQDNNEKAMYVAWLDKTLTPTQVKDAVLASGVRLKFGKKLMEDFYKDEINPQTDPSVFIKVKQMQADNRPLEEVNQFILDNSNNLTNQDKKSLINTNYYAQDKKDKMTVKFSSEALGSWANKLFDSSITGDTSVSSDIVYDFLQRVDKAGAKGNQVDAILKDVQKDYIKKYTPSTAMLQDVPNIIATRNKIQRVYQANSKLKGVKPGVAPIQKSSGMGYDDF